MRKVEVPGVKVILSKAASASKEAVTQTEAALKQTAENPDQVIDATTRFLSKGLKVGREVGKGALRGGLTLGAGLAATGISAVSHVVQGFARAISVVREK